MASPKTMATRKVRDVSSSKIQGSQHKPLFQRVKSCRGDRSTFSLQQSAFFATQT
jgi:hypothetical protein